MTFDANEIGDHETLFLGQNRFRKQKKSDSGFGIWGNLYGYEGRFRTKSDVFTKFKNSDLGMQFGIDLPTKDVGTCFYYTYATPTHTVMLTPDSNYSGTKMNSTHHLFGLRLSQRNKMGYFLASATAGFDGHEVDSPHLSSDVFDASGWQLGVSGEAEFRIPIEKWAVKPHFGLDYRFLHHNELNNSQLIWHQSETYNTLTSIIGLRTDYKISNSFSIQVRSRWEHNFLQTDPVYSLRFGSVTGLATPSQIFFDGSYGRDWLISGTGLQWRFGHLLKFFGDYDLMFNKYTATHIGSVTLVLSW